MPDPAQLRNVAAIAGIGHTEFSKNSGRSEPQLAVEAIRAALDDCGLTPADVDGMVRLDMDDTEEIKVINNLGVRNLRVHALGHYGGGSPCGLVLLATMMIATRQADVVVGYRSMNERSGRRFGVMEGARYVANDQQWTVPFGLASAGAMVAMSARRQIEEFGWSREHYAAVSLACREHAQQNPGATFYGSPLTIDDYMNARMIAEPLCLFDYCLETDGACAWVVVSAERARDLPQPPAYITGASQGIGLPQFTMTNYYRETLTTGYETVNAAENVYAMAGVGANDIDVIQVYDHFTPWVIMALEDFGFAPKGEGGPFAATGALRAAGGELPLNTSGGQLSEGYIHGHNLILEAVRQVRGTSTNQLSDVGYSMCTSGNGVPTSALILTSQP